MKNKSNRLIRAILMNTIVFLSMVFLNFNVYSQTNQVLIQGFNWESQNAGGTWYTTVQNLASDLKASRIDMVWLPPSSKASTSNGYLPTEYYNLNSAYGTQQQLITLISTLHANNIKAIGDMVLNHRNGTTNWADFTNPTWGCWAVTAGDEWTGRCGNNDTGLGYASGRDVDHTNVTVQNDIKAWMLWMKNTIGFDGWRYDFALGYSPMYTQMYNASTNPVISIGEIFGSFDINNPNANRQQILDYINGSGGSSAFDFTTKGILNTAVLSQLNRLSNGGQVPGLIGVNPSKAVTFIDNHDTGGTQNQWPFPSAKVMLGYCYILMHPGIPMVFYDHFYTWGLKSQIQALINIRKDNGLTSTSTVSIQAAQANLYAAIINGNVAMKIGSDAWSPGTGWNLATSGTDYAVWIKSSTTIPVTGISVSPLNATVGVGATQQITTTISPGNATDKTVTWSSSNTAIATVNASGLVSGVSAGSSVITVRTNNGGFTASSAITVTGVVQQTPYSGSPIAIPGILEAEYYDKGGEAIAYHDNETANNGSQLRTTEGVDIEVCGEGGYNVGWINAAEWIEYTVNVSTTGTYAVDVRVASTSASTFHIEMGGVDKTGILAVPNTGGWQTWQSVTKTGLALTAGTQIMRVYMDGGNFNINRLTFTGATTVPVTGVNVSPTSASKAVGTTQQLTATVSPSNATDKTVTWSSSNTALATVNASGLVTCTAAGSSIITVRTNNGGFTATSTITVTATTVPVTGVIVSPTTASKAIGTTQQLTATVSPSNATDKTVTWSSSNTAVATVNASGLVTCTAAGSSIITVRTNNGGFTATSTITVTGSSLTYYRIKNRWQNTYLTDGGDRLVYSTLPATPGLNYEWIREDLANGQFELKNASTGEYMHIENQTGFIQCTARISGWASSRWSTETTDNGWVRLKNAWQPTQFIHIENLTGFAQHGTINAAWWSAQWLFEALPKSTEESSEIEFQGEVSYRPNPVVDELNIEFNGNSYTSASLLDISGKIYQTFHLDAEQNQVTIDMSEMKSGIYFIRLQNDISTQVIKLIKK